MASNDQITNQQDYITKKQQPMYSTELNTVAGVSTDPILTGKDEYQKNIDEANARLQMAGITQAEINAQTSQAETSPGWFEKYIISPLTAPLRFTEGAVLGTTALARDSILHEGAYNSLYGETHKNVFADVWNTAVDAWNKEYLQSGDQRLTGDNLLKFMATGDTDTSDWNFWTKLAVSLPVDILLDPLTYLGAPIFKATAKGIKYGTGETIKIVESLTPTFRTAMKETGLTAKGVRTELNENLIKLAEVRTPNFIEDFDTLMKQKTEMSHRAFKKLNANANAVKLKELQRTLTNADRISELRKLAGPEFASRTVANRAEKELSSSTKLINEFGSLFKKLTGNGEKGGKIVREARNNSLREIRKEQSLMKRLARKYGENTRQITNKILADPNWKHDVELILKASNSKIGEAEIEQIFKDLTSLDKKELVRGKKEIFEALDRMQGNIIGNRVTKTWFEIVADILNTELKGGVGSQNFTLFNLGANDLKTVLDKLAVHSPDDLQALSDIIVREYNPTKFAKYSDLSPFHFNPETTPIDKIIGEGTILSEEQIANLENKLYAIEVKGNTKKNLQIVFNGLKNASKTTAKELEEATAKWNAMWKAGSERQFKQAIEIFANALDLKPGVTSIDTIRQNPEALFNPFLKESLFPDLLDPAQIEFFKEYNPKADEGLKRSLKKAKKKGITITPFLKEQSPYKDKSLITSLKRYGRENNIYKDSFNKWEKIVKEDALTNNEYETFLNELSNIEKNYNKIIASETYKADSKLNEFVSEQYKKVRDFNQKLDVFNSEIKMDKDFLEKYKNYKQVFENFRTEFPELTTEIDKLEKGFEGLYNSFRLTIKEYQNLFRNLSPELKKIVEKIPMDTHSLQELKTTLDQPITKVETVLKQPETKFGQPSGKVEVKPSEKQINTLKQFGVQVPETSREASTMIGALKANGWKTQGLDLKLAPKDLEEKVVNLENKVEELAKKKWTIQDMPDTARNRKILKEDILKETGELTTEDWKVITEESGIPFTSVDDLTKDQLVTLIEDNNFKMSKISKFQKVVKEKDLTYEEAIAKIKERGMVAVDNGMSEKQLKIFTKNKITPVKTSAEASKIIKTIAQKGWRLSEFDVEQINQKIADKALKLTQAEAKKAKQAAKKAAKLEKETTKLANQNVKLQTELEKNAVLPGISDVELQKEMKQLSEDITRMLTKERNPFPEIDSYFKVVDEFKDGGLNSVISLIGDDTLEKLAEKASIENLANIVNDIPKVAKAPEIKKLTASLDNKIREHFGMDKVEWDNLTPKTKGYFIDSLLEEKSNPNVKKILKEVEKQTSKVIEEVKTEVSKIEEAVKVVEEKAASLDDIIKELPKQGEIKFKDLGKKPAQIKKSTKKVEKQVTQIKEEISKIEEPIQEIKKVEYEIKNEISKVEEGLDDIPEDMKQISEEEINAKIKAALNKNKLPQPATKLEQPATKLAQPETKVLSVGEKLKSTLDKKLQEKIDLELEQATKKAEELKKQAAKEIPFGKRPVTKSEKMYIDRVKAYSKKYDIDYQTLFEEAGVDGKTKLSELTHTELGKIVKEYNLNIKSIVQEEDTTGEIVREVVDEEGGLEVDEFDNTEEKASSTSHIDAILELKNKNFDSVDQIRTYAKTNKIPQEDILIEAGIEDKGAFSELTPAETKKLLKFYNPKGAKKTTKAKKVVIDENSPVGKLKAYAAKNNIPAFKMFKDSGINKLTFDSLTPEEITKLSNKYLSGKPLENVEKVVKEENWVTKRIRQYSKDNNVSIDEIFKKVGINTNNFDDLTLDEFDKLADEYLVNDTFLERTRTGKESLNLYNVSKYAKENNITIPTFLKNVGIENKSKLSELTRAEFKKVMDKYNIIKEEPIKAAEEVKKEVSKIEEPLQEVKKEVSKIEEPLQEVKKEITSLDKIIEELPKNDEISKIVEEVRAEVKVVEEQITKIEEAVKEPITKIEEVKPVKRPRVSLENKVREHFGMSESNWDSLTPKMKEDLIGSLSEEDLKNIKKRPTPKKKNLKVDSPEIARLKEFRRLEDMSATDMFRGAGIDKFSFDSLTPDEITKLLNFYDVKVPKVVENVKPIIKETPKAKEEIINIQKELDNISKPIEKITTKIEPTKKVKIGLNEFGLTPPLNKEIPALLENGVLPKNILNDEIIRLLKQSDEIKANGGLKVSFLNKFRDITKETLSRKTFLKRNFTEEDLLTMAKELKIPVRELEDVPGNLNYILPEKFSEITGVDYLGKDPKTNSWFFKDKNGKNFRLSGENGSSVKIPLDADQQISERFFTKGMDPEKIKSISTLLKRQGITFKDFSVSDIYDSTYRPKLEEPLKELPKEEVSKIVEPIKEVSNTGEFLKGKDIKSKNKRYTINDFGLEEPLNRELSPLIKPTEIVFNDAEKEKIISKLKEKDFIGEINSYGHYNFNDNFYSELSKKFPDTHQSFRKKLEGQWGEGSTQSLALHWRGGINYLQNWKKIANISDIPVKKYVGELNKMLKFEPERVASALNISYLGKDPETFSFFFTKDGENFSIKFNEVFAGKVPHIQSAEGSNIKIPTKFDEIIKDPEGPRYGPQELNVIQGDLVNGVGFLMYEIDDLVKDLNNVGIKVPNVSIEDMFRTSYNPTKNEQIFKESANKKILPKQEEVSNKIEPLKEEVQVQDEIPTFKESPIEFNTYPRVEGDKFAFPDRNDLWSNDLAVRRFLDMNQAEWDNITPKMKGGIINNFSEKQLEAIRNSKLFKKVEPLKELPKEEVSKIVEPIKEDVAKLKFTINDDEGMHYRPSAILSSEANKFKSDINFLWNGENVNAKSILSIAKQNIKNGQELEILAKGTDSVNAIKSIEQRLSEESKFFQNISTNLEKGTEVSPTELVDRPINVADYNYSVNEAYNLLNENWKNYDKFIKENNLSGLKSYEILGTDYAKEYSKITSFGDMLQEELDYSLPKIITQNTTKDFLKTVDLNKMSTDDLFKVWQDKVEKTSLKETPKEVEKVIPIEDQISNIVKEELAPIQEEVNKVIPNEEPNFNDIQKIQAEEAIKFVENNIVENAIKEAIPKEVVAKVNAEVQLLLPAYASSIKQVIKDSPEQIKAKWDKAVRIHIKPTVVEKNIMALDKNWTSIIKHTTSKQQKSILEKLQKEIVTLPPANVDNIMQKKDIQNLYKYFDKRNKKIINDLQKEAEVKAESPMVILSQDERLTMNKYLADTHGVRLRKKFTDLNPEIQQKLAPDISALSSEEIKGLLDKGILQKVTPKSYPRVPTKVLSQGDWTGYFDKLIEFSRTSNPEKIIAQGELNDLITKYGIDELTRQGREIANLPLTMLKNLAVNPEKTLNNLLYHRSYKAGEYIKDVEKNYLKNMATPRTMENIKKGGTSFAGKNAVDSATIRERAFAAPKYVGTARGINESIGYTTPFFEESLLKRAFKTNLEIKNIYKFEKGMAEALKTGGIRLGSSIPDTEASKYKLLNKTKFSKMLENMADDNPEVFKTFIDEFNTGNLNLTIDTSTPGKLIFRNSEGAILNDQVYIQRNIDNILSDKRMALTAGDLTEIGKAYDNVMRIMKSSMLYTPGYLVRVFFGNITQHIINGGTIREFVQDISRGWQELEKYKMADSVMADVRVHAQKFLPQGTVYRDVSKLDRQILDTKSLIHKQLIDDGYVLPKKFKGNWKELKEIYNAKDEIIGLGVLEDVGWKSGRSKLAEAASFGETSDIKNAFNPKYLESHPGVAKTISTITSWPIHSTIKITDSSRLGAYLNALDNPERLARLGYKTSKTGAAEMVKDTYFDIMKLNNFEEKYMTRIIPFYRFFRLSVEQNLKNLAKLNLEPYRKINKLVSEAWLQTGAFDEGGEGLNQIPGFALTGAWIPLHVNQDTGKVTTLKWGYTPSTLFNMISNPSSNFGAELFSMANPFIKTFSEFAFSSSVFTGKEYEKPFIQSVNQNLNPLGTRMRSRQSARERAQEGGYDSTFKGIMSSVFYSYSSDVQVENYLKYKLSILNQFIQSLEAQGYFIPYFDYTEKQIFQVPELFGANIV